MRHIPVDRDRAKNNGGEDRKVFAAVHFSILPYFFRFDLFAVLVYMKIRIISRLVKIV